jgi:hypothetical protein
VIDDERGAVGGMRVDRGNCSTRKSAPAPLCPPQIPHNLTWGRSWAATAMSCPQDGNYLRHGKNFLAHQKFNFQATAGVKTYEFKFVKQYLEFILVSGLKTEMHNCGEE